MANGQLSFALLTVHRRPANDTRFGGLQVSPGRVAVRFPSPRMALMQAPNNIFPSVRRVAFSLIRNYFQRSSSFVHVDR